MRGEGGGREGVRVRGEGEGGRVREGGEVIMDTLMKHVRYAT